MLIADVVFSVKACHSTSVKNTAKGGSLGQNLPIPISDESEKVVRVGFLQITLVMEMPAFFSE